MVRRRNAKPSAWLRACLVLSTAPECPPATVSLTLVDGRGATVASATPVVLAAGPASGVVAGPSLLGAYTVTVVADAGQGRVASVDVNPVMVFETGAQALDALVESRADD